LGVQVVNPFQQHIKIDPTGFYNNFLNLKKYDASFVANLREKYKIDKRIHYQYLGQVIKKKLPNIFRGIEANVSSSFQQSLNFSQGFSEFIDFNRKRAFDYLDKFTANKFKQLANDFRLNKLTAIKVSNNFDIFLVVMGLKTALSEVASFAKLIFKLQKESKNPFSKSDIIRFLNGPNTKKTISQLMKLLHVSEFKEILSTINIGDHCGFKSYDPTYFNLTDNGIEFNSQTIDLTKYTSSCPVHQGASPPDNSSPTGIKQEQYDSSRRGCPANHKDLDQVIEYFVRIINLVPDEKFTQWNTNS
jgi:hypothetical protein